MIHVLAEIRLRPGARDAFTAAFARLVPLVCAEDGCLEYGGAFEVESGIPVQLRVRDDVFHVVEKWRDLAALAAHLQAPHMDVHRAEVADLTAGTTIRVLQPA